MIDPREACAGNRYYGRHSPESLPAMREAKRARQICLYCKEPLFTVSIDRVLRWVGFEFLIEETPW